MSTASSSLPRCIRSPAKGGWGGAGATLALMARWLPTAGARLPELLGSPAEARDAAAAGARRSGIRGLGEQEKLWATMSDKFFLGTPCQISEAGPAGSLARLKI